MSKCLGVSPAHQVGTRPTTQLRDTLFHSTDIQPGLPKAHHAGIADQHHETQNAQPVVIGPENRWSASATRTLRPGTTLKRPPRSLVDEPLQQSLLTLQAAPSAGHATGRRLCTGVADSPWLGRRAVAIERSAEIVGPHSAWTPRSRRLLVRRLASSAPPAEVDSCKRPGIEPSIRKMDRTRSDPGAGVFDMPQADIASRSR
jgi:hypothetical protein